MKTEKISELTTNRLSVYLRCLNELVSAGIETVSSQALAEQFNLNSAQIRKDLANFGEFGVRGVGYYVSDLRQHLLQILGLTADHRIVIVGAGNLGLALANYQGFNLNSFHIVALLDSEPAKIGMTARSGLIVGDAGQLPEVIRREEIDIVIITVPAAAAEQVLEEATLAGVKAVLNFAPVQLHPQPGIKLKNVDLAISLESLSYFLARPGTETAMDGFSEFLSAEAETKENGSARPAR